MKTLLTLLLILSGQAHGAGIVTDLQSGALKAGVDPDLIVAICFVESRHRNLPARMDGGTNSHGVCQVKLATAIYMDQVFKHKVKASPERLADPMINAFYAAKYLKYQLKRYQGDVRSAIDAYNKGRVVSNDSEYVRKVLAVLPDCSSFDSCPKDRQLKLTNACQSLTVSGSLTQKVAFR